jgi:hypothetical protein
MAEAAAAPVAKGVTVPQIRTMTGSLTDRRPALRSGMTGGGPHGCAQNSAAQSNRNGNPQDEVSRHRMYPAILMMADRTRRPASTPP